MISVEENNELGIRCCRYPSDQQIGSLVIKKEENLTCKPEGSESLEVRYKDESDSGAAPSHFVRREPEKPVGFAPELRDGAVEIVGEIFSPPFSTFLGEGGGRTYDSCMSVSSDILFKRDRRRPPKNPTRLDC